jgi:GNAT superfamily N-acetyltransferase
MEIVISPQTYTEQNISYTGKLISAVENGLAIAQIGFVKWNVPPYEKDGKKTARILRYNNKFGIEVSEKYRERGIGPDLMERLFDQLLNESFERVIIEGAQPSRKGFVDTILSRLKAKGKILSYDCYPKTFYPIPIQFADLSFPNALEVIGYKYVILLNTKPLK